MATLTYPKPSPLQVTFAAVSVKPRLQTVPQVPL